MTAQNDPFSDVRMNRNIQSEPFKINSEDTDPFSDVRINKIDESSGLYETGRHASRIGSRIAETIGGIPGDVTSLLNSGLLYGMEKLGFPASEEFKKNLKESRRLPTSSELKQFSQEKTKGFTTPQNDAEEFGDRVAENVASLIGPMKFRKSLGIGLGSELAKEGAKLLGFQESEQEAAKLGTMFMMTLYNPKGAMNYATKQYDIADQLAKGASINVKPMQNSLLNLKTELQKGLNTPVKENLIKHIDTLNKKISSTGKLGVDELMASKKDVSTLIGDPSTLYRERKLLKPIGKHIDNAIKPYEKINKPFSKAYRPANEIYSSVMQGQKASNFIKKNLGAKSVIGGILFETATGHPEAIIPTIGALGGAKVLAKGFDLTDRIMRSNELRKLYSKALIAAAKEDLGALRLYESKLQDALEKEH